MTRSTARALCFGEGLVVLVPTAPGPLEDSATFSRSIGGAEVNVAIALAGLGVASDVLTRVGDDGFGRHLTAELARHGVGTEAVEIDSHRPTGLYVKEIGGTTGAATDLGPGASRMHYYRAGSAMSAASRDLLATPAARRALADATLIHTTGITPGLSAGAAAAQTALAAGRQPGQLLAFDLNWRPALWRKHSSPSDVLAGFVRSADIVLLGASEASAVFGLDDPAALRREFPQPRWLVVKNDGEPVTAFDGPAHVHAPTSRVEVVEPIGAGDAFAAGLLSGIVGGRPLDDALATAHRTAARALTSSADHVGAAL
ncbi:MAG: sugar kinase [Brevundimonas sp.]